MIFDKTITLSNGVRIPKFALGTWLMENEEAKTAVRAAIEAGYRHIDTAGAYGNEAGVGDGVYEGSRNAGIDREKVFVTSKIPAEIKDYKGALNSIADTLKKTELDYIDLMLIHCPQPWDEYNKSDNRYYEENLEVWRALEDVYFDGKIRAIGVSNFNIDDIENIRSHCRVKPMVNQVLAHIGNTPFELIDYCKSKDIAVEAYSPIAHGKALKHVSLNVVAQKYGVSVPQLCLKYDLQLGLIVLPKTTNPEHMKTNAQLDFVISDEDMEILKNMENI